MTSPDELKALLKKVKRKLLLSTVSTGLLTYLLVDIEYLWFLAAFLTYVVLANVLYFMYLSDKMPYSKSHSKEFYNKHGFQQMDQSGLNSVSSSSLAGKSFEAYHHHQRYH